MHCLFWFRKPNALAADQLTSTTAGTLMLRLTVNAKRLDCSTGLKTTYGAWNAGAQAVSGRGEAARLTNARLLDLRATVQRHYYDLERAGLPVSAERLRHLLRHPGTAGDETLLDAWQHFAAHQATRHAAGEIGPFTVRLPALRLPGLTAWLAAIGRRSLLLREVSAPLMRAFYRFLLSPAWPAIASSAYAAKYVRLVGECCACAVERGVLAYNPLARLKLPATKKAAIKFLYPEHVAALAAYAFEARALSQARDAFLFFCYTGLSWADARAFRPAMLTTDRAGQQWLHRDRIKSGELISVPLLPEAAALLAKYHPKPVPIRANAPLNMLLKDVGAIVGGLPCVLTCHVGRKTFGMLALDAGVSLAVVSAMLGHASERQTASDYAKIKERRIGREMREAGLLPPVDA